MAPSQAVMSFSLVLDDGLAGAVWDHLFADADEHGAVILAGLAETADGVRLIGRTLIIARDGIEYVPGVHGYRRLTPEFVRSAITRARDEKLGYLAVHNHGGLGSVAFSDDDRASHARGYPALLDISRGGPVGALVIARDAVAGELWLSHDRVVPLTGTHIAGPSLRRLYPNSKVAPRAIHAIYDRQTRIFGAEGQGLLRSARVGVIGAGGGGMLLVEYLARLGVGSLVVVDPDRVSLTNLPRLPGSRLADAQSPLGRVVGRLLGFKPRYKVDIAARLAREANPSIRFEGLRLDLSEPSAAAALRDVDFLFCAADTMRARLVFNALVQQYGIPGIQLGAKAMSDASTGLLTDLRSVVRHVSLARGCLWCNGLISPARLAEETLSDADRATQRYVDDPEVAAPAVITLNAVAASIAANDFLLYWTGVRGSQGGGYLAVDHRRGRFIAQDPRRDPDCPECGDGPTSRRAMGDRATLPVRANPEHRDSPTCRPASGAVA